MNAFTLVFRELAFRRVNAFLSVVAVAAAVAAGVGAAGLLASFDAGTETIIAQKQAEVKHQTELLQEEYRKIGTSMGFNVLILPKEQNLGDLYANDFASHFMPESYVDILASSPLVTIRHLLPTIQQKITWPERKRTIILVGTRGEVPFEGEEPKKGLLDPVPPGQIVFGHELAASLEIKTGETVRLMGKAFTVKQTYAARGTKDDITAWLNLKQAQEILGKNGLISGIMALECNCAMAQIGKVREEIAGILPNTQVIEFASKALTRAESRRKAAEYAEAALESEKQSRVQLREQKEGFIAIMLPLVLAAAALWVGLLALLNMRERRIEIGILRAIGRKADFVLTLFTMRAVLIGCAGGVAGYIAGAVFLLAQGSPVPLDKLTIALALGAAPVLSVLAAWIPSLAAAQQDPAIILRKG